MDQALTVPPAPWTPDQPHRTPEEEQRSHTARMLTPDALGDMWRSYEAACHERGITPRQQQKENRQ